MTYLFRDDDDLIERVFAKGIPIFAGHDRNTEIVGVTKRGPRSLI
jgi:hypothetical protein